MALVARPSRPSRAPLVGDIGAAARAVAAQWPCAVVALIVATTAAPFVRVSLPLTHDGLNHLHRLVMFDSLVGAGVWYPRLYPDFALGYGYPVGNYYPPLALFVAELPLLVGFGPVDGLRLAFLVALALGSVGAFLAGRRLTGAPWSGVLATALYGAAPYLLVNVYDRGALPEALALGIAPFAVWAALRWDGGRSGLGLVVGALALLVLAHPMVAAPIWAVTFGLWWARLADRGWSWRLAARGVLVGALAAGLTAFSWLPATLEASAVALDNFAAASAARNAVPWTDVVDPRLLYDFTVLPYRLSLAQGVLLALGGALVIGRLWRGATAHRARDGLLLGSAVACLALASSLAAPFWDSPVVAAVQFPWRLLGPAALGIAMVVAATVPARGWLVASLSAVIVLSHVALLNPGDRDVSRAEPYLTPGAAVRRERSDGTIGATTAAEYLPQAARTSFAPDRFATPIIDSAPFAAAELVEAGPLSAQFRVRANEPTRLRLHAFWFPGWQASVDGQPAPTFPDGPYGLVAVAVPPGEHAVAVWFGDTPPRAIGWVVAVASALTLVVVGARAIGGVSLMTILALAFGPLVAARPVAATLSSADLGAVRLVGGVAHRSGSTVRVTAFWQTLAPGTDATIGLRALDRDGAPVDTRIARAVYGSSPTSSWSVNELTRDERALTLPASSTTEPVVIQAMADGRWTTVAELPAPTRQDRIPWPFPRFDATERARAINDCLRDDAPPRFGDRIALRSVGRVESSQSGQLPLIAPGQRLRISLGWEALASMDDDYTVFVHLVGPDGRRVAQSDSEPVSGLAPTSQWRVGQCVVEDRTLLVPADAPPGQYEAQVGLYLRGSGERLPRADASGSHAVAARYKVPLRQVLPPDLTRIDATFGDIIDLVGYRRDGDALTLFWRARAAIATDYTVFAHLLDSEGRIIAQADHRPRQGAYPTTIWAAGEVIDDSFLVPLVEARAIRIGLYRVATGERLTTRGGDSVTLPPQ